MPHGGEYNFPMQAGSGAGGGLFRGAPPELMQPSAWSVVVNDFLRFRDWTAADWTTTAIGAAGTVAIRDDVAFGVLRHTPPAVDNQGAHVQFTAREPGELWLPASGRTIVSEWRVACGDWDGQDYFFGLAETNVALLAADGSLTCDNLIGFHHQIADSGLIECVYTGTADANETDAGDANSAIFTNSEFHTFGFRIQDTTEVSYYVDGAMVQTATMGVAFDDAMCVSFGNVGSGAATDVLDIDYFVVAQTR